MVEAWTRRLNWGCGRRGAPGWINADRVPGRGIDIACDIREGLPLDSDSMDYVGSVHALQEIPLPELVPVLGELRRVIKPGGVLRLCLPDMEKNVQAYLGKDRRFFAVPDEDASSLGGKLITQLLWYGFSRVLFTEDFIEELLLKAGFARILRCSYRETWSPFPGIVELDNREAESLFIEAFK